MYGEPVPQRPVSGKEVVSQGFFALHFTSAKSFFPAPSRPCCPAVQETQITSVLASKA